MWEDNVDDLYKNNKLRMWRNCFFKIFKNILINDYILLRKCDKSICKCVCGSEVGK